MGHDGARWIEELPAGLAAQQGLLRGLLAFSQADPDVRWLVLGCSLARGAGDWLSDIDAAVGVVDEQLPAAFPRARSAVDGLGELVESFHHQLPGLALTHERIFAQYADRSQLDLVVYPATVFAASIPDVVPQPQFGLTSVLDYTAALPDGMEETVSGLDVGSLLAAGLRVAELLGEVGGQLSEGQRAVLPLAMGSFVLSDLRAAVTG
jgi:hypothetical protein